MTLRRFRPLSCMLLNSIPQVDLVSAPVVNCNNFDNSCMLKKFEDKSKTVSFISSNGFI